MTFGHIELFVRNPVQAMNFYTDVLGFEVITIQDSRFVWLKSDTMELLRPGSTTERYSTYQESPALRFIQTIWRQQPRHSKRVD